MESSGPTDQEEFAAWVDRMVTEPERIDRAGASATAAAQNIVAAVGNLRQRYTDAIDALSEELRTSRQQHAALLATLRASNAAVVADPEGSDFDVGEHAAAADLGVDEGVAVEGAAEAEDVVMAMLADAVAHRTALEVIQRTHVPAATLDAEVRRRIAAEALVEELRAAANAVPNAPLSAGPPPQVVDPLVGVDQAQGQATGPTASAAALQRKVEATICTQGARIKELEARIESLSAVGDECERLRAQDAERAASMERLHQQYAAAASDAQDLAVQKAALAQQLASTLHRVGGKRPLPARTAALLQHLEKDDVEVYGAVKAWPDFLELTGTPSDAGAASPIPAIRRLSVNDTEQLVLRCAQLVKENWQLNRAVGSAAGMQAAAPSSAVDSVGVTPKRPRHEAMNAVQGLSPYHGEKPGRTPRDDHPYLRSKLPTAAGVAVAASAKCVRDATTQADVALNARGAPATAVATDRAHHEDGHAAEASAEVLHSMAQFVETLAPIMVEGDEAPRLHRDVARLEEGKWHLEQQRDQLLSKVGRLEASLVDTEGRLAVALSEVEAGCCVKALEGGLRAAVQHLGKQVEHLEASLKECAAAAAGDAPVPPAQVTLLQQTTKLCHSLHRREESILAALQTARNPQPPPFTAQRAIDVDMSANAANEDRLADLEDTITSLRHKADFYHAQWTGEKKNIVGMLDRMWQLEEEAKEADQRTDALREEFKGYVAPAVHSEAVDAIARLHETMAADEARAAAEKSSLQRELGELREQSRRDRRHRDDDVRQLNVALDRAKLDCDDMHGKLRKAESRVEMTTKQLFDSEEAGDRLRAQVAGLEGKLAAAAAETQSLKDTLLQQRCTKEQILAIFGQDATVAALLARMEALEEQNQRYQASVAELTHRLGAATQSMAEGVDAEDYHAAEVQMEGLIFGVSGGPDADASQPRGNVAGLQASVEQLQRRLDAAHAEAKSLVKERDAAAELADSLRARVDVLASDPATAYVRKYGVSRVADLDKQMEQLHQRCVATEETVRQRDQAIEQLNEAAARNAEQLATLSATSAQEKDELEARIAQQRSEFDAVRCDLEEQLRSATAQYEEAVKAYEGQLAEVRGALEETGAAKAQAESNVKRLMSDNAKLVQHSGAMKTQLTATKAQLAEEQRKLQASQASRPSFGLRMSS